MSSVHIQADRQLFTRWVRATFGGYLLGFVFIILAGIAGDPMGMPEFSKRQDPGMKTTIGWLVAG